VHRVGDERVVLFHPVTPSPCVQGKHLIYRWDGEHIAQVLEVSAVKRNSNLHGLD
jgi:hypothetical protein